MVLLILSGKNWTNKWSWPVWLLAGALLAGCAGESDRKAAEGDALRVVATTGMIADVVRNVGGPLVNVKNLVGEGIDPHLYNPTRGDVVALNGADLVFYNGLLLEGRMGDVLQRLYDRGRQIHAVADWFGPGSGYPLLEEEDGLDPHLWMDVGAWTQVAGQIAIVLSEIMPEHAEAIQSRAAAFRNRLSDLDEYARVVLGSIPERRRILITAHDAFGYMGRAYGIEVRGIQGISTDSEAGVRDIEDLIRFIIARDIPAVFVETSIPDKNVRALIEGSAARGHTLRIGGELFSDAMGPAGSYTGTYIGMIDHNVSTIAAALGGVVPEGGFREWSRP